MDGLFVQIITPQSGTTAVVNNSQNDILMVVDAPGTLDALTMPVTRGERGGLRDKQVFGITTRSAILSLTWDADGRTVHGAVSSLRAGRCIWYIYIQESNAWFPYTNPDVVAGAATWGAVGGNLPDQLDLQTALDGKLATNGNGSALTGLTPSQITGYSGYVINVQALTSSPADGATIYFGMLPKAPVTAAATSKIFIRQAGTIKRAEIYCFCGTAGTAEAWPVSIRLNNTTDTLIASLSVSANERVFSNTNLNIAVAVGSFIEIKAVNPTWVTNPLTCIWGGYIYIE